MQTLSIIIPFYNEQATLKMIVERVLAVPLVDTAKQLILVDDGSTDGSADISRDLVELHPDSVRHITMPSNCGKGAAVRRGLQEVQGSLVVIQDADLEYDPFDLQRIVDAYRDYDVNVVFGSRRLEGGNPRGSFVFHRGGQLITGLTNLLYGSRLTDQPTCYKSFRSEVLNEITLKSNGFEFCAELTAKLLQQGYGIVEVPIRYSPRSRKEGKKIRPRDGLRIALTLIQSKFSSPLKPSGHLAALSTPSGETVLKRESSPLAPTMDLLLLCSILILTFFLACFPNQDMDLWWHLKAGRAILQGHGIATRDAYTIAGAGHEWIDLHWLFQASVAYVHGLGGVEALTIAAAVTAVLAIAAGIIGSSTRAVAPFLLIPWLPALFVMSSRFLVRPEIVTLACLAAYFCVLRNAETRPKLLWSLVPIQIFWTNVQGLFCFGPFLLSCWLIDRWIDTIPEQRRRFRIDTMAPTIGVLVACFANPYGWRGAVYPLTLAKTMFIDGSFYRDHIAELASPLSVWQMTAYRDVYVWTAGLLFAMTASSFLAHGVRIRVFRVTVFAVFSGLALTAVRNLPQYALVAACVQTWNLADGSRMEDYSRRFGFAFRVLSITSILGLLCLMFTGHFYPGIGSNRILGFHESPLWHAHDAARFAAREGMPDRILAYHEGQAALVEFYMRDQQRVYVDSRLEVMHRGAMESYYKLAEAIAKGRENWAGNIAAPATILIDHTSHYPLEATILSNPDWTCAMFGPVAAVYVPTAASPAPREPSGDLARRHFASEEYDQTAARPDSQGLRNGLNSDLLEASALLNIARASGERPTSEGTDRRVLLLLAMRMARDAVGDIPYAAYRIGAGAAFQMYAAPTTDPENWQVLEIVGLARSRYLLSRCQILRPGDFVLLADEYAVVSALGDPDAIYETSQRLCASKALTAHQVRFQSLVKQNLNSAHLRATVGEGGLVDTEDDVDGQIQELFDSRRFLRIRARFASDHSGAEAASAASASSRSLVAMACLLCGDPDPALKLWHQMPGEKDVPQQLVRIGIIHLIQQEHSRALEFFKRAASLETSSAEAHCAVAMCYLELGNAALALNECNLALKRPQILEGRTLFCQRMRDFAKRYVPGAKD